ncbi:MAG: S41 family peptidase [Magnetococcales bacterium]|nr:S41 family peptidase [Magnetococcales bacterium]
MKGLFRGRRPIFYFFILIAVLVGLNSVSSNVQAVSKVTYEKLRVFSEVYSLIQQNYVKEVDEKEILYGAIHGMLKALDPHSSFLTPESFQEMQVDTKGEFGGLGIEISRGERGIKIVSPIEDTPADRVGIKAGDLIIKIDDTETDDMNLMEAVKMMRGKPGTEITLTIYRKGELKPLEFTITRAIIKIRSVRWRMEEHGIGYVRVIQFNEQSYPLLETAIDELNDKAGKKGLQGLVLDLRNDPGGLLDQAVQVADAFLDKGLIVYTKGRIAGKDMSFEAHSGDLVKGAPIVVLINAGSASASEIVSGALQDHHRAVVLGTRSFGKGSVQTIIPLNDGSGLRLTTAQYYTPSGRSIQAKGIEPDIIVEDLEISGTKRVGRVKTEADLKGHLQNANDKDGGLSKRSKDKKAKKNKTSKTSKKSDEADKDIDQKELDDEEQSDRDRVTGHSKEDYQLRRALDLLRGFQVLQGKLATNTGWIARR